MIGVMVFAVELFCPLTITLLVGVIWFAGTMTWLRRQREKQAALDSEPESRVSSTE